MTGAVAKPGHQHKGYRRNERVGEAILEVLAEAIERHVDDPRLGLVTVTHVDAAPDLRTARVYVSVLGAEPEAALAALTHAHPVLQREIAAHLRLMWTPRLTFVADTAAERAFRIDRLLGEDEPK
jgi:ribosome-binding factor A